MNGQEGDAGDAGADVKVNDACVRALAKALSQAKRGEVRSVAIITVDQAGDPMTMMGGHPMDAMAINFAADLLKQGLLPKQQAASSPILRPGH